jgi:hypothetical protein
MSIFCPRNISIYLPYFRHICNRSLVHAVNITSRVKLSARIYWLFPPRLFVALILPIVKGELAVDVVIIDVNASHNTLTNDNRVAQYRRSPERVNLTKDYREIDHLKLGSS